MIKAMTPVAGNKPSVLITGCSTGIGFDAAVTLQSLNFEVFATARKQQDVDKLRDLGLKAKRLDLTDEASIDNTVKWVLSETGGTLYALFNNGAYGQPGALEDLPLEALKAQFDTNFFGWHSLTQKVIPIMREQGFGRIIQNSSVLGFVAMPYRGAYNASKFAIEGYTDTLRLELSNTNIQVSLIEPGPIETRFRANALAKIQEYIDVEHSAHKAEYLPQIARLEREESSTRFTLPASAVTKKLVHALMSKKAKARYYVTTPTYLMAIFKRILPITWLDKILAKG
jgi:NAD(P)-dependent dehydrogenase (short-subunit alcohol dehydrogenase family)